MTTDEFRAACNAILKEGTKPTVPDVLPLATFFHDLPGNEVGGCLHLVLDDPNYDDGSVEWCIQKAAELDDEDAHLLGRVLRLMSMTQRRKVANLRGAPEWAK